MSGRARTATVVALLAALVAAVVLPAGQSVAAGRTATGRVAVRAEGPLPVTVSLTSVSPVQLDPTSSLTVTGVLRNTGRTTLDELQVNLRLTPQPLMTRKELGAWAALSPRDPSNGTLQEFEPLTEPLLPGRSQAFTVTIRGDATRLPTTPSAFGPHGLAVEVQQFGRGSPRLGILRTFAVWNPLTTPPSARLALLVPVTSGTTPLDPTGTGSPAPDLWAPGSRLSRLLQATGDPAFSYAVDPALPAAARAAQTAPDSRLSGRVARAAGNSVAAVSTTPSGPSSGPPSASPSAPSSAPSSGSSSGSPTAARSASASARSTSPSGTAPSASPPAFDPSGAAAARTWLDAFVAAGRGRQTAALPFGDPDVAALAAARHGDVVDEADEVGTSASRQALGTALPGGVIWPVTGRADLATAALAATGPGRLLVLRTSAITPDAGRTATATATTSATTSDRLPAHARITVGEGRTADVLLADDTLSDAAAALGGTDATLATQRLLAETAALAAERGTEPVTADPTTGEAGAPAAVATLPRDWDPDPYAVRSSLTALKDAAWLDLTTVDAVRAQPAVALTPFRLVRPTATATTQLGAAHVGVVASQLDRLDGFRPALGDGPVAAVWEPSRRSALELLSTAWIRHQDRLGSAAAENSPTWQVVDQVDGFYAGVTVYQASRVNLLTWSAPMLVSLDNHLPFPVTVTLDLHPRSLQVVVRQPPPLTLLPGRTTVRVTLQAKANGGTTIIGTLNAGSSGGVINRTPPIDVWIHPEWQGRGLTWIGGVLALLLVVGLVRGVRRGRGRERISPDAVPDPDDIGREPVPADGPAGLAADAGADRAPAGAGAGRAPDPAADRAADVEDRTGVVHPSAPGPQPEPAPAAVPAAQAPFPVPAGGATRPAGAGAALALAARTHRLQVTRPSGEVSAATHDHGGGDGNGDRPDDDDVRPAGAEGGSGPETGAEGGSTSRLLSSSAWMAAGTLTSRVLGMVRVAVLAWAIGVRGFADPFAVANTLPNNLFILIGGGVLNAVLVPQIVRAARDGDGGQSYIDRLVTLSIVILGGATVVATALSPVLIRLYEDGWTADQISLATGFAVWCLPQIFFYGLYTIYGQILNARESYGPYMWAPVVNNVVAIAGCVVFIASYGGGGKPATWWGAGPIALLAGTATLGVVAQALVLLPALRAIGYRWHPRRGFRGMGLGRAGTIAGWTFAGVGLGQLVFLLVSRLSTHAAVTALGTRDVDRGRALWDNAYLLFFLPHSLAAVSLVTAVFTRMASAAAANRTDDVRADVSVAVRLTGVVTVLATVAFVVLGRDLARAVFLGLDSSDTDSIALVTGAMVLGLVAFSASYLFQRVYYAYEDARTPFAVQVVVLVVWTAGSLLASAVLAPAWVTPGIGLAMSLSNVVGVTLSAVLLRRRIGGLDGPRVLRTHVRLLVAALVAGLVAWVVDTGVHALAGPGAGGAYLGLATAGLALVLTYAGALKVLRVPELDIVAGPILRRLGR